MTDADHMREMLKDALRECMEQLDIVRPRDGYDRAHRCRKALQQGSDALAALDQPLVGGNLT